MPSALTRFRPLILVTLTALIALSAVTAAGAYLLNPGRELLSGAAVSSARITPNADGTDDLTRIVYTLAANARVTISFNDENGKRYLFRDGERRSIGSYEVLFSGVVEGDPNAESGATGVVEARLIPDGTYTWQIDAVTDEGAAQMAQGSLLVEDGDAALPYLNNFDVVPRIFTPNQDGVDDRISVNVYLAKDARLSVYLESGGQRYYVPERDEGRRPGEAGAHVFDYDAGIDNGIKPPPNGVYQLIALAEDAVGQRVRRETTIELRDGGLPQAEIVAQSSGRTITWESAVYQDVYATDMNTPGQAIDMPTGVGAKQVTISLPQSDLLVFRLTVYNYGTTPIRTIGPWPGTVYQYDQTNAAMVTPAGRDAFDGAFRVGLECERSTSSYPYRWAIGAQSELTKVDRDGESFYYLMPGQSAVVWGAVRMTTIIRTRNPQKCFAALIHENVNVFQGRTGEIDVKLETPLQAAE